jgi:hypothetical protein
LLARVKNQRRSLKRNVRAALTSLPTGLPDPDEHCAIATLGTNDLRSPYETPNPLVGVCPCNVHENDLACGDSNSGTNGFSPNSHVCLIRDIDPVMNDRRALHAKASASVLRARRMGIEHDGPWTR